MPDSIIAPWIKIKQNNKDKNGPKFNCHRE